MRSCGGPVATATSHPGVPGLGSLASAIRGCRNLFGNFRKIPMKCGVYKQPKVTPNLRIWAMRGSARGRCGSAGNCVRSDINCRSALLEAGIREAREIAVRRRNSRSAGHVRRHAGVVLSPADLCSLCRLLQLAKRPHPTPILFAIYVQILELSAGICGRKIPNRKKGPYRA